MNERLLRLPCLYPTLGTWLPTVEPVHLRQRRLWFNQSVVLSKSLLNFTIRCFFLYGSLQHHDTSQQHQTPLSLSRDTLILFLSHAHMLVCTCTRRCECARARTHSVIHSVMQTHMHMHTHILSLSP